LRRGLPCAHAPTLLGAGKHAAEEESFAAVIGAAIVLILAGTITYSLGEGWNVAACIWRRPVPPWTKSSKPRAMAPRGGHPYFSRRVGTEPCSWYIGARLASGCGRAYRVRMTTAAKFVWILIALMLMLSLLGALASTLISPG
jgi:hypothetical protein